MAASVGLVGYDSFHFVVQDLDRSAAFYEGKLGFSEVARSSDETVRETGEDSRVYGAGDVRVCVTASRTPRSEAGKYLRRHPAGIPTLAFQVGDLDHTVRVLTERGATLVADPINAEDAGGTYRAFDIATPLGDVTFRFIERKGFTKFAPGFVDVGAGQLSKPANRYGISAIDHITSNGLTMQPIVGWYRELLGFEQFWDISFHTQDVIKAEGTTGSGLKSIVMWDPESGIKFATNEPLRPFFSDSQIAKFVEDNHGNGVQHIAFAVTDIINSVEDMKRLGCDFLATPKSYFDDLPDRLQRIQISNVTQDLKELERLQILVDGGQDKYMLQIFMREAAVLYNEEKAGPFFYEIIQRCGDPGFGYGNFRALFESIERAQRASPAPTGRSASSQNPGGLA